MNENPRKNTHTESKQKVNHRDFSLIHVDTVLDTVMNKFAHNVYMYAP